MISKMSPVIRMSFAQSRFNSKRAHPDVAVRAASTRHTRILGCARHIIVVSSRLREHEAALQSGRRSDLQCTKGESRMKYSLMISAALLLAIGHTQPASAQTNPTDLIKLGVEAQGGA